jgi:hypothetical protein
LRRTAARRSARLISLAHHPAPSRLPFRHMPWESPIHAGFQAVSYEPAKMQLSAAGHWRVLLTTLQLHPAEGASLFRPTSPARFGVLPLRPVKAAAPARPSHHDPALRHERSHVVPPGLDQACPNVFGASLFVLGAFNIRSGSARASVLSDHLRCVWSPE